MATPADGSVEQAGDLRLTSPAFEDGGRMPDSVGFANDNANPPLRIENVPDGTESLVLIVDDPEAEPVVGHVWDHWLVYNIPPDTKEIPEGWDAADADVAYNDYVQDDWGGPAPPEGTHTYHFKLYALDSTIDYPPQIRKARLGSVMAMEAEILAQTELTGQYDAAQGTIF